MLIKGSNKFMVFLRTTCPSIQRCWPLGRQKQLIWIGGIGVEFNYVMSRIDDAGGVFETLSLHSLPAVLCFSSVCQTKLGTGRERQPRAVRSLLH